MTNWIDTLLIFLVLSNLSLLGTSRLNTCIRIVAFQGVLLGIIPLAASDHISLRVAFLSFGSVSLKGVLFPWLLNRALRDASVHREVEPYVGFTLSTLAGILALILSLWLGSKLPLPDSELSPLAVPVAFFTILVGLFLIVSRKQALTQVLGYLVLENGVYAFGAALVEETSLLVELGILLDVFVAVFVMGITIFHISREFDHIDTEELSTLKR